jgi:hypothetical protein
MEITTILTAYRRQHLLKRQINAIKKQTVKSDIWVWRNNGDVDPIEIPKDVTLIDCSANFKFHGRFAAALLARTKYVAIFDDDCIPNPKWFENCIRAMKSNRGIMGSSGVILKGDAYLPNLKCGWTGFNNPTTERVDLVGHAWFFEKDWVRYMWYEEPASWDNGEDIQFSYCAQKYGGINTFVPPHPKDDQEVWGNTPEIGVLYGNDIHATHKKPKHYEIRNNVCRQYIKKGWKLWGHED